MGALKNIGYFLLSTIGLCLVGAVVIGSFMFSAALAVIATGVGLITLVALGIKEYFETPSKDRDR